VVANLILCLLNGCGGGLSSPPPVATHFSVTLATNTPTAGTGFKVLVAGGGADTAELFDTGSEMFTPTGPIELVREHHTATLLNDGTVPNRRLAPRNVPWVVQGWWGDYEGLAADVSHGFAVWADNRFDGPPAVGLPY
jgi:hypothetical protein